MKLLMILSTISLRFFFIFYDFIIVRGFKSQELPSGPLFRLLQRLRDTSLAMNLCESEEKENMDALARTVKECWTVINQSTEYKVCISVLSKFSILFFKIFIFSQDSMLNL